MKKIILSAFVLIITSTLLNAAPYDYVERKNWHLSMTSGATVPIDSDVSASGANPMPNSKIDWEVGPSILVAGGYTWDNWRFELEYGFRKTGVNNTQPGTEFTTDTTISYHSLMANIAYDWYFARRWYWYNGFGLGVARSLFKNNSADDSNLSFSFQGMTGFGFQMIENMDVYWGYRIFRATDTNYDIANTHIEIDGNWMHNFEAGIRIRF